MANLPAGPARLLKSKYLIAALVAALFTLVTVTGFVWATRTSVTLIVDGQASEFRTDVGDVAALLELAEVPIAECDLVTPSPDTAVEGGMTVTVRHATPVTLILSEGSLDLDVVGSTVADVLVSAGLDPASGLDVSPAIDAPLEPGMIITAADVFLRVVEEEVEIPFEIETVEDPDKPIGTREVLEEGSPGRRLRIFEVVVTDGAEGARVLRAERVLTKPVPEVLAIGTKRVVRQMPVSRGSERSVPAAPETGTRMTVLASAYTPGHGCGYNTATGAVAGFGVVAVDPSVIPLGTRLYIPGYGYGVAADTGGAIGGNRIDLCFDTLGDALAWGRRTVTITIVD